MRRLPIVAAFVAVLLAGCGVGATSQSTQPEETTASVATGTTQPENTAENTAAPEKTVPPTVAPAGWVSAIGDSVMLGAVDALQEEVPDLVLLSAQGSRQPAAAIDILQQFRAADHLGDAVVVHIGNNGPFTDEQFAEMMRALADVRKVLIVNLTVPSGVPDPIAVPNNAVLANGAQRYPNAVLVDWHAASANHAEFFGEDGTHLTLEGAQAYAALIASYLEDREGSSAPPGPQERITSGEGGTFGECIGPSSWCLVS
jgi:lysophospholipase L1-like esterase